MGYLDDILKSTKQTKARRTNISDLLSSLTEQVGQSPVGAPGPPVGALPANPAPAGVPSQGGAGVDSWVNQALSILKLDPSYAPGIKNMIQKESGGNPRAINKWDSNWKKGTPSKGLMQTIDPTFKQWALPGYDKDVYDPVSNILAGIRYAQNRYGDDMLKAGGRKNRAGKYIGY